MPCFLFLYASILSTKTQYTSGTSFKKGAFNKCSSRVAGVHSVDLKPTQTQFYS